MDITLRLPVRSHMFGRVEQESGFWHKGKSLQCYLLVYIVSGGVEMKIADEKYTAHTGDILLIPPETLYVPLFSGGCTYYFFHFGALEGADAQESTKRETYEKITEKVHVYSFWQTGHDSLLLKAYCEAGASEEIADIFSQAASLDFMHDTQKRLLLDNLLQKLLIYISPKTADAEKISFTLRKILIYIKDNYNRPITLGELSEKFGVSKSYIDRLFKYRMHTTFTDYTNKVRLEYACTLLLNSDMRVGEVAMKSGFENPYYFSRIFKARLGMTPTQFRGGRIYTEPSV